MANDITSYTFSASTQVKSAEVNTNFDDIADMQNAKFSATLTANQAIDTSSATLLAMATEVYDPGANYDNTAANYSFTVPITGYYYVSLRVQYQSPVAGKFYSIYVDKNGGTILLNSAAHSNQTTALSVNDSDILSLTAADVLQSYAYHEQGSSENIVAGVRYTSFTAHLLSV